MNTKQQIYSHTRDGLDVFNFYMPFDFKPGKKFRNPLYQDTKASCCVYFDRRCGFYRMEDFGAPEYSGDCFWFVATLHGLDVKRDFIRVMNLIIKDLMLNINSPSENNHLNKQLIMQRPKKMQPAQANINVPKRKSFKLEVRSFTDEELAYWGIYGINLDTLKKFEVTSVAKLFGTNSEDKPYTICSNEQEPMFAYRVQNCTKIYRPKSKIRFLYASASDHIYIFGMGQLPTRGSVIFITGGEKDVMSLSAHGFNAICFNSETANIPNAVIESLKRRFKHIVLLYDMDETGRKMSNHQQQLLSEYGLMSMELPLSGEKTDKDVSDFFAKGGKASELRAIFKKMIEELYAQTSVVLESCELDYDNPPDPSKIIVGVNDVPIGTCDNLLCITGGEGVGKSHYVAAIISGTLVSLPLEAGRTLGLSISPNKSGKAVLLFDTEQSEAQLYKNVTKTLKRANIREKPDFYHPIFLTAMSRKERLQLIKDSMDMFFYRHKGIQLVVIDGIADLIRSANDETESIAVVDELYRLAGIYNTCIVCVLHFVPNGIKLRGHIGSELQRKASGILSIEKEENQDCSVVKALKVRDGSPLDIPLMTFKWDKKEDMFMYSGEKSKEDKDKWKKDELITVSRQIFHGHDKLTYSELVVLLKEEMDIKDRTAKKYIAHMKELGIVTQDVFNNYIIVD